MKKSNNITHVLIALIIATFTINYAVNSFSYIKKSTSTIEEIGQSETAESNADLKISLSKYVHPNNVICSLVQFAFGQRLNEKKGSFFKSINSPHGFHLPVFLDNSKLLI